MSGRKGWNGIGWIHAGIMRGRLQVALPLKIAMAQHMAVIQGTQRAKIDLNGTLEKINILNSIRIVEM